MKLITRLLTAIKSLFIKRGNNVEGNENSNVQLVVPGSAETLPPSAVAPGAVSNILPATGSDVVNTQNSGAEIVQDVVLVNADSASVTSALPGVKALLKVAGHDVDTVWDDAVAYAQKVAAEESELVDKLVSVLLVAGHDVADIIDDALSFARKHGKA
ncbi:hypothetical protein ACCY16_02085 [Candidatus Pantoea formicae]|uniref:hypothetical protein n=1 Tax=Candidatus Pantoea formicae TaxID=2608355 RepID=UPI003EDA9C9C